jgi:hypothetical protein
MPRRRRGARIPAATCLSALLLVSGGATADGVREQPLFRIERSKNANVVEYAVRLREDGSIDPKQPVVGYWLRFAREEGRRKDLTWVQRIAYGFKTKRGRDGVIVMKMRADIGRELRITRQGERYQAEAPVDGHPAYLEKVYVKSIEGGWRPRVEYLDLFGQDVDTGEPRYERFTPD